MSSNIEFKNDEFRIEGADEVYIKTSKHLKTHEERVKYRNNRELFMKYYNDESFKPYLDEHGFTHEYLIKLIKAGNSLELIAAIVYQFAMQKDYEEREFQAEQAEAVKSLIDNAESEAAIANIINQIQNVNFEKEPLVIVFTKGSASFKSIQQALKDKLDSYDHISELYVQYKYFDANGILITRSKPLASKEGLEFAHSLISDYYLKKEIDINKNEFKPIYSDTNEDGNSQQLTISMIKELRFCHKNDLKKPFGEGVKIYADNGGAFLKYKINDNLAASHFLCDKLLRYQITNDLNGHKDIFKMNCLVYALSQSGKFDETTIQSMMCKCFDKYISHKKLEEFACYYNLKFIVSKWKESDERWINITNGKNKYIGSSKKDAIEIKLGLYHKYYFFDEQLITISEFAINHYDDIKNKHSDKDDKWIFACTELRDNNNYRSRPDRAKINSKDLVKLVTSNDIEFSFEEQYHMSSSLWDVRKAEIKSLEYCDKDCIEYASINKSKKSKASKAANTAEIKYRYFYADFECDISDKVHVPSFCACKERGSNEIHQFWGPLCQEKLCEWLPDNSVVYFHNLGYDATMFSGHSIIMNAIDKGSKTIRQKIKYHGKNIILRDSYVLISVPLKVFPFMFGLKTGDKEVCPYKYLTNELLENGIIDNNFNQLPPGVGIISEAGANEKPTKWNQQRFEENISKHGFYVDEYGQSSNVKTDYFDAKKYLAFYCEQDVNILAAGFDKFRELALEAVKIDVDNVLTASSLAEKYFERELYTKVQNYYKYAGVIREYIQGCVV